MKILTYIVAFLDGAMNPVFESVIHEFTTTEWKELYIINEPNKFVNWANRS